MKKNLLLRIAALTMFVLYLGLVAFKPLPIASTSDCFNYQAIIRDKEGKPIANRDLTMRISVIEDNGGGTGTGKTLYSEIHSTSSNPFGLVNLKIGCGESPSGDMSRLDWGTQQYWLSIEGNPEGGKLVSLGKSPLMGGAFAAWARHSGDWKNQGDTILRSKEKSRVGIGIDNPMHQLSVAKHAAFGPRIYPGANGTENGYSLVHFKNGNDRAGGLIRASKGNEDGVGAPLDYQGIRHRFTGGPVYVIDQRPSLHFENATGKNLYWEMSPEGQFYLYDPLLKKYRIHFSPNGRVGIGTTQPNADLDINGTTRTKVLEITGGSDLAEWFNVAAYPGLKPEPGMLVSIDPDKPGQLSLSTEAYDKKIAGIISGANGIQKGMTMGQKGSIADGQFPIALTGRVYVKADASMGAIQPGDQLTSSSLPGYAMKVNDYTRAHGAVIGKAMTALEKGKGYVLVLVNLQ